MAKNVCFSSRIKKSEERTFTCPPYTLSPRMLYLTPSWTSLRQRALTYKIWVAHSIFLLISLHRFKLLLLLIKNLKPTMKLSILATFALALFASAQVATIVSVTESATTTTSTDSAALSSLRSSASASVSYYSASLSSVVSSASSNASAVASSASSALSSAKSAASTAVNPSSTKSSGAIAGGVNNVAALGVVVGMLAALV